MEIKAGNLKIGADTLIFNLGSATHCPSGMTGQCDLFRTKKCYAMKAELQYPDVLPYRERQKAYWYSTSTADILEHLKKEFSRKRKVPIKFLRWNEAGDVATDEDLIRMVEIAEAFPSVVFYTYTHNQVAFDAFLSKGVAIPKNLVFNLSNFTRPGFNTFQVDGGFSVKSLKKEWQAYRADAVKRFGHRRTCIGDCSKCSLCKVSHGKEILVPLH
jgi:hypothetical protein